MKITGKQLSKLMNVLTDSITLGFNAGSSDAPMLDRDGRRQLLNDIQDTQGEEVSSIGVDEVQELLIKYEEKS